MFLWTINAKNGILKEKPTQKGGDDMQRKMVILLSMILAAGVLASCGKEPIYESTGMTATETTAASETTTAMMEETTAAETTAMTTEETTVAETTETAEETTAAPEKEEDFVYYSDFGAKGDGKTDDFKAIKAAHRYANVKKLPVKADEGAVYLIGNSSIGDYIDIITDTDWTGATFIMDDRSVLVDNKKTYQKPIFRIAPGKKAMVNTDVKSLSKDATNIGFAPGMKCVAMIEDTTTRIFIRTGIHAGAGDTKREIVLIDEYGNIDPSTPLTWDYKKISSITLCPIDEMVLTVRGGTFHTIVNEAPDKFTYYQRAIRVERSNVVLEGITHTTEGELERKGAPYAGFIYIYRCSGVTVKDCVFTPHYIFAKTHPTNSTTFGYDAHVNTAVNVRFVGCTQTIDIDDSNYWGVFTSNFARNLTLEDCVFSRFDAHEGVYNVTIKGCTFGHQGIRFVGFGEALIEDTTVRAANFVLLRNDYGSTLEGKLTIRNCRFEPQTELYSKSELIRAINDCDHDYGYPCHFPTLEIDGLFIDDTRATTGYKGIYILPTYTERYDFANAPDKTRYHTPEQITLRGIVTASGKPYQICRRSILFADTKIIEEK